MFRHETERAVMRAVRMLAAAASLCCVLAGCSDIYFARRDTVALSGGEAIAANAAEQISDPWPPYSGNTQIAANGQKMQSAIERYRTGKVTQPINPTTSAVQNMQQEAAAATTAAAQQPPISNAAAPPVAGAPPQ